MSASDCTASSPCAAHDGREALPGVRQAGRDRDTARFPARGPASRTRSRLLARGVAAIRRTLPLPGLRRGRADCACWRPLGRAEPRLTDELEPAIAAYLEALEDCYRALRGEAASSYRGRRRSGFT